MNDELSKLIGAAFRVHNELGFGFLESVYEKALAIELKRQGIGHAVQPSFLRGANSWQFRLRHAC